MIDENGKVLCTICYSGGEKVIPQLTGELFPDSKTREYYCPECGTIQPARP